MQPDESRTLIPIIVVIVGLVLSPLATLVALTWWIVTNNRQTPIRWDLVPIILGVILLVIGFHVYPYGWTPYLITIKLLNHVPILLSDWLSPHLISFGAILDLISLMRGFRHITDAEALALGRSRRKEAKRVRKQQGKRPTASRHALVFGVSGSGKTAGMVRDLEAAIQQGKAAVVIDGKGGVEKFSLYWTAQKLAKREGVPFVVVDARRKLRTVKGVRAYNPFANLKTEDQIKDAVISMIDSGVVGNDAGFYQAMTAAYALQIGKILIATKQKITYKSVISLADQDQYRDAAAKAGGAIEEEALKVLDTTGENVKASFERLATAYRGAGQLIFGDGHAKTFSLAAAVKKNAVVVVLLDEFSQQETSKALANLVINDIKTLVGSRLDSETVSPLLVMMDEFSVYGSSKVLPILNKARSAGVMLEIATQSLADIDGMDGGEALRRSLIDNASEFYVYRLNDATSAEEISKIIGTYEAVTQTVRSNSGGITDDGSNTISRGFKVSPDDIKELRTNSGIYYDKAAAKVTRFKNEFIKFED